jgi:hypothetical protein
VFVEVQWFYRPEDTGLPSKIRQTLAHNEVGRIAVGNRCLRCATARRSRQQVLETGVVVISNSCWILTTAVESSSCCLDLVL